jgi:hypothetical protein
MIKSIFFMAAVFAEDRPVESEPRCAPSFPAFDAYAVDVHHLTAKPSGYAEECHANDRKQDGSAHARARAVGAAGAKPGTAAARAPMKPPTIV